MPEDKNKRTEVAELGEYGLIEKLTEDFEIRNSSTLFGAGDDSGVISSGDGNGNLILISTDLMLEGINFDLVYFPLKHLGYKAVVVGINDILAMNGSPSQITFSIGVSAKLSVEDLAELYEGVRSACREYEIDLVGGDTTASVNGLVISVTAVGTVDENSLAYRSGARLNDLICVTGDLGGAYLGLHLLEREKRAFEGHPDPHPKFEGYEYLLGRQLKPAARVDIIESLHKNNIVPTAMIDLSDGLSSDLLQICRSSGCGARIYLDRLPIAKESYSLAEELNIDPVVAALNGGDDHELLFTVPIELEQTIRSIGGIDIIGHITNPNTGAFLITPDGGEVPLSAPGIR